MRRITTLGAVLLLGACTDGPFAGAIGGVGGGGRAPTPATAPAPAPEPTVAPSSGGVTNVPAPGQTVTAPPRAVTSTVGALDRVSEAEKAEARQEAAEAASTSAELGSETVGLGDPGETGLWVKTGLVTSETPGTVTTASGESVAVTLRPLGGAGGAQISLSALQALGLPLVGLHPVTLKRS